MQRKNFFWTVAAIAVPVGLQSMLQSSFAMVDQMMAGQLGSTAVAAIEVASRPAFIYSVVLGALSSIAGIMVSQYLGMDGKKDVRTSAGCSGREMADRSLSVSLTAAAALALFFTVVCLLFPGRIIGLYLSADPAVESAGKTYLVRIAWTYLPMGISSVLAVMIRCMGRASYPLYAGISSAAVNTVLNYVLIFGRFGFPRLGLAGAAAASVISQLVNLLLILFMFYRIRILRHGGFCFSLSLGPGGLRRFLLILLPVLVNELMWSLGQNVNTFIYGHLGKESLAAMAMTGPVQGLFTGALSGVSQAAGILIGKRLGAEEYDEAYRESVKLMGYGLAGSLALSLLLACVRNAYVLLYQVEPDVREISARLLLCFALLAPVKVANMILGGGIVRSGGKTAYIMVIDLAGTWFVGVPLGLLCAFVFRLPVHLVYFILSQEELVRFFLTLFVFKRRKWMDCLKADHPAAGIRT